VDNEKIQVLKDATNPFVAATKQNQYAILPIKLNEYMFIGEHRFIFNTTSPIIKFTAKQSITDNVQDFYATTRDLYYFFGDFKSVVSTQSNPSLYKDLKIKDRQHLPQFAVTYL
jgi:hypothetical protein